MPADVLIVNGRVFRGFGPAEPPPLGSAMGPRPGDAPTAVAISGEHITWLGDDATALRKWRGPSTEVVDALGGLVMAGFDDAHFHLLYGARSQAGVDLFGAEALADIQERIAAHARATRDRPWVVGRGWLYAAFPGAMPVREQLDAVVADRPAFMGCFDGHTGWVNSAALRAAGVDRDTPDPRNGAIVRDPETGEPTGALTEGAMELVTRLLPEPSRQEDLGTLRQVIRDLHVAGITAVQDAEASELEVSLLSGLRDTGELPLRVRLAMPMTPDLSFQGWQARLAEYRDLVAPLDGGTWLSSGILKAFADGVVESRTAAMLEPYADDDSTGRPEWEPAALASHLAEADRLGWQVEIHAIGDAGIRMALDAFEATPDARRRRHRVEHIEVIAAADIPRFGQLGVVASMQPYHADPVPNQVTVWVDNVGPERANRAWAWASLRRAGAVLALGSDWPVVPFDPFLSLNVAVNRQNADGFPQGGWIPEERLGLPEALAGYTTGSAYAAFADGRRGTIAAGYDADLVVLDRDLLEAGPSAIIGTSVRLTVVGGRIVHRREDTS